VSFGLKPRNAKGRAVETESLVHREGREDLVRSLRFYRDGLSLVMEDIVGRRFGHRAAVFLDSHAGEKPALWSRSNMAEDAGLPLAGPN